MNGRISIAVLAALALAVGTVGAQGMGGGVGSGSGRGYGQGPGGGMGPGSGMGSGSGMGPGAGQGPMVERWSRERMFGTRMMTLQERQEHMQRMWNANTLEERNRIREEHRKLMLERARRQNFKIDEKSDDTFSVPEVR